MNIEFLSMTVIFISFLVITYFIIKSVILFGDDYIYYEDVSFRQLKSYVKLILRSGRALELIGISSILALVLRIFMMTQKENLGSVSGIGQSIFSMITYGINFLGVLLLGPVVNILTGVSGLIRGSDKSDLFGLAVSIGEDLEYV